MGKLEKMIKYLDGEVIGEEKQLLEKEIESSEELTHTLHLIEEVDTIIQDEKLVHFVTRIQEINDQQKKTQLTPGRTASISWFLSKKFYAAASISLLIILSSIFYFNVSPSNEKLFNQYYNRYDACFTTRGNTEMNELVMAIQLYDQKLYNEAISHFNQIIKKDHKNTTAYFFMGISYMETKAYDKAIQNLNKVVTQKDTAFMEHAEWYLALCYLKTNQSSLAKIILKDLANSQSYYYASAKELYNKLK
jgi:tetratricopeptide (TPR) repeat protein